MDPNAYWNELCNRCFHTRRQHHSGPNLGGEFRSCKGCDCPMFVDRLKGEET